jgi:hypothetical protein
MVSPVLHISLICEAAGLGIEPEFGFPRKRSGRGNGGFRNGRGTTLNGSNGLDFSAKILALLFLTTDKIST